MMPNVLVRDPSAEARLLEMLDREPLAVVRSRVASALAYREPTETSFRAQNEHVLRESDDGVRATLQRNVEWMRDAVAP